MSEHAELLTAMLDDLLANDAEIVGMVRGGTNAEVEAAALRTSVTRRLDEALAVCVPEKRQFDELRIQADARVRWWRRRPAPARHRELVARADRAERAWQEALRERGLKPLLRDEWNLSHPPDKPVLPELRADGLAEIRNPLHVVESAATVEVERLMALMPGGSIGISGHRGAGKTTLLEHFCDPGAAPAGDTTVRVLLPAPVRYDAREFVLHLFAMLCYGVLGPTDRLGLRAEIDDHGGRRLSSTLTALGVAGAVFGACLVVAAAAGVKVDPALSAGVLIILGSLAAVLLGRPGHPVRADPSPTGTARAVLVRLAYQQSFGTGWNRAVKLPAGVELGASSTTTMAERPMTYPEIVAWFREFLGEVAAERPVHIGIDELDKFDSTDDARAFLNDIKGVLAIRGCFFLIAVSEDAMCAFERRGLPLRDAFDSTFDTVVDVRPLTFADSEDLLRRRVVGLPAQFAGLVHVMSGGLPRDLIRVARDLVGLSRRDGRRELGAIAEALTAVEVRRKLTAARLIAQRDGPPAAADALAPDETPADLGAVARTLLTAAPDGVAAEAATYLYFCATVREYFARLETAGRVDGAATAKAAPHLDRLAAGRRAFSAGPRYAWSSISAFRADNYLGAWDR